MSTVLVTGGSGFVASHVLLQLLDAGHTVRTTVRSPAREATVRELLSAGGVKDASGLTFHIADLSADAGWGEATAACDYVLHVASPFPPGAPKHEDDLIVPAREGTLRVLRAARDAGVKRVVQTSSFAAVGYGHPQLGRPLNESDWTNLEVPGASAYVKSKTLAERAAWRFIEEEGGALELSVINPPGIYGPVLGADFATSIWLVKALLAGRLPALPRLHFGVVDVRDVASLHLLAMTHPEAKGQRFLANAGPFLTLHQMALALRQGLGERARRVPTRELPDWVVRLAARLLPAFRGYVPELGKVKDASNAKARQLLGWTPRPSEEALVATGESLFRLASNQGDDLHA